MRVSKTFPRTNNACFYEESNSIAHYFFLQGGQKMDLFTPRGAIISTLWPATKKLKFITIKKPFYQQIFYARYRIT